MGIRLVATDIDGTLVRDDLSVSPRTRAALDDVRAAGIVVVPVTARQPHGLREVADAAGFDGWALCSNGGLAVHLGTDERLFDTELSVEAQTALVAALDARVPGLLYASVRQGGEVFVAQREYAAVADYLDHKRDPASMTVGAIADVLAAPSLKFIVRHPTVPVADLLDHALSADLPGFGLTHSGAPFLEVLPEGVTKASGLARLCAELGIAAAEVMAFGDALNDREMVEWAGHGVAVANAVPAVLQVADEVTATNEEDGVALVLERLLAEDGVSPRGWGSASPPA